MPFNRIYSESQSHLPGSRRGTVYGLVIVILVLGMLASFLVFLPRKPFAKRGESGNRIQRSSSPPAVTETTRRHEVTIRRPAGPPRCDTGLTDREGNAVTVSCATCHATRRPNFENKTTKDLNEFHGNLVMSHGSLSCLSCHNSEDYDSLKLADGSRVEFADVMTLCAQCHGQQMKDYEHGAHGGMTGHWDLSRGPRTKNNCIDCHTAHSPQFPKMVPTFKPRDRFLGKESH